MIISNAVSNAMNMLLRGCDLYSVKEQMRHEFISTTEIYIKSNPQTLRNNYQIFCTTICVG